MSAQEPVIAVSNEPPESERVDPSTVLPSEHPAVKDVSSIADSSPVEPVTEPPAETAQTVPDDTPFILPKHTNIPNATPTSDPVSGVDPTSFVNEPDHAVVPVEVRNVDEVVEDKAPINYGVNGDVKGITLSSGLEGADLDPADQTLVEGLSQDADTSVIQGTVDVPIKVFNPEKKIMVECDEDDMVPETVAAVVKDAEQDEVPDVTLAPEVAKSVPIPIEEQNPTPAKPELKVESHLESVDAEPPIIKPVGVGVTSDPKDLEPVVHLKKDKLNPSEEPVSREMEETEVVFTPTLPPHELVVEPIESKPAELADDAPPVTEDALEPEPIPTEPIIIDLDKAKTVEPHAGELEVAPEPIEIATVIEEVPKHIPEAPTRVEESVVELEVAPTVELKDEVTPPVIEPVVEGRTTQTDAAPVVMPSQEPTVEAVEVPSVPREVVPLPLVDGHRHPDNELVEPVEKEIPEVTVPEELTPEIPKTPAPGDLEPKDEEFPIAKDEVDVVVGEPQEVAPPVQDEIPSKVEDADPTTETFELELVGKVDVVESESVREDGLTETRSPEETLPVESTVPGPVSESSSEVKEVVIDAEPVVATPLFTLAAPEYTVDLIMKEEGPAVDSIEDVAPDVVAEEPEVPVPGPIEEVEEQGALTEVTEQGASPVLEPPVELKTEEDYTPSVLEPEVPMPEPAPGNVPLVQPSSVINPQEPDTVPPVVSNENPPTDEAEPEENIPTVSEIVEATQDVPTSDIFQEESNEIERSQSSWTPSYSVNSQGGGLDDIAPADEEVVEPMTLSEPPVEEAVDESASIPEIVTSVEEPAVTDLVPAVIEETESEPIVGEPVRELTQVLSSVEEPTTVEPEPTSEEAPKSPAWMQSYSTTVQGSTPRFESRAVLKGDSEPISSELPASIDVPNTMQDAEPKPATIVEVPEPTITEDDQPIDEAPTIDAPPDEPSEVFNPSLGQTRLMQPVETETERPKSPWTPSYTVTTLPGSSSSPHIDPKPELDEEPVVEVEADVLPVEKVEAVETPKIITPGVTSETPSWTESYSVTSQPGSHRISPKVELEPEPQPIEPVQETSVAAPIVELADVPKTVVTPAVEDEDDDIVEPATEEEPKPAWTRSYSVTSQPGSPRVSPKQVSEEIPEVEEVKPSWTQSYSVTSQPGSPRVLPKEDLPEPTVESVDVADEPKSPWTSSYSVTTLEGQTEQAPSEDIEPESEVVPVPRTLIEEAPEPTPEVDAPVTDTPSEPLVVGDEQPKGPKSPWTPSYSVTTLPGSVSVDEPASDSVVDKSSVDVEAPAPESVEAMKAVEDQMKENGTTSDLFEVHEAIAQSAVHEESRVDIQIPESAPLDLPKTDATIEVEEKSSWTPSYSVTRLPGTSPKVGTAEEPPVSQDIPTVDEPATKEVESTSLSGPQEVPQHSWNPSYTTHTQGPTTNGPTVVANKDDGSHYFPRVPESLDEAPERPKLDLLTSIEPPTVSKISPRGRYASTTSSRLFPGGWFSSPKSPGDEGRASMEEATGEFILSKSSVAPNEPAVAEAPEDLPASPITPSTPTTRKDKKWRMCEIM